MEPDLSAYFLWNVDPVMFHVAGRGLRWYSFFYFLVFLVGYALWHWQMIRGGHDAVPTSRLLLWMLVGLLTGARLGHCLFYEPEFYLSHPLEILNLSRGGVSSHGGTVAIFITLALYARRFDFSFPEVADRISFATMFGAALVRFGNFFNSEIVGREWYGPWAVRFPRFAEHIQKVWERTNEPLGWTAQPLPRHPVQLYEALGIWCVLALLFAIDRRHGEDRPRGLLAGLFCCLYFVVRFIVEYWKEYLRFHEFVPDAAERVIRVVPTAGLTMGQSLSLPFIAIGAGIVVWSLRTRLPASKPSRFDVAAEAS
jgi:prolipoprotein diacylglyceryl transferase